LIGKPWPAIAIGAEFFSASAQNFNFIGFFHMSFFLLRVCNVFRFAFTCPVGTECDYYAPVCTGAKLTAGTGDIVPLLRGANDSLAARRRFHGGGGIFWNDCHHGTGIKRSESIGVCKGICRKVYCETFPIGKTDCGPIACGKVGIPIARLVGISKAPPALVCLNKPGKRLGIYPIGQAGEIARLIMAPNLPHREGLDLRDKPGKRPAPLAPCYFLPMHAKRTPLCIASARF
jgi:hypothetical protein